MIETNIGANWDGWRGRLLNLRQLSASMAEDDGLWFVAQTAAEAYLQQKLRALCAVIEAPITGPDGTPAPLCRPAGRRQMSAPLKPHEWTEVARDKRWQRGDGAAVEKYYEGAKRPWYATRPDRTPLAGRLYADWDIGTGATRCFGSAKSAMRAMDKDCPAKDATKEGEHG